MVVPNLEKPEENVRLANLISGLEESNFSLELLTRKFEKSALVTWNDGKEKFLAADIRLLYAGWLMQLEHSARPENSSL